MEFFNDLIGNFKDIVTKKYFCFEGRAGRKEFWMFILANVIINAILGCIPGKVGLIIKLVYALALLLPFLGVTARRLHDTGKSGWFQLLYLIAGIGNLIVLILCIPEGEKEANKFGAPVAAEGCCCCENKEEK